jgi:hypothetical protein
MQKKFDPPTRPSDSSLVSSHPQDDLCTETLTIRIDQRTLQRIEALAGANGLKRSEYIRDILRIAAENRLKITYGLESFQLPTLKPAD